MALRNAIKIFLGPPQGGAGAGGGNVAVSFVLGYENNQEASFITPSFSWVFFFLSVFIMLFQRSELLYPSSYFPISDGSP